MTFLRSLLAIFLVLPLAACALSGEAIEGQVLEEGTNKPIAGAIVVVRWQGRVSSFVDSQGVCYHVETATTDEQGRYQTKSWSQPQDYLVSFDHIAINAYKPGYGFPDKLSRVQGIEYLAPFRGTRAQRMEYLIRMLESTRCGSQNDSERNLHALYLAIHDEAKGIAVSKDDAEIVDALRYWSSFVILDKSKPTTRDAKGRLINVDGQDK